MKQKKPEYAFDEILVLQYRKKDNRALGLLHKRWHQKMIRHAIRIVKSHQQAQDVVQEAWISIMQGIEKLKSPPLFGPWALRIVYFKAVDHLRKQKTSVQEWSPPESDEKNIEQVNGLISTLKTLPENHRLILSMFYLDQMPIAEIAYILGIPPGTVKSRLFKAREYFKKHIKTIHHEK
jgi:RNA polymerase sigma-70 factor (ECF subfamily)